MANTGDVESPQTKEDTIAKAKRSILKKIWDSFTGEINPDAKTWDDYPKNTFGWFLSVFPKKSWKIIILIFSIAIGYGFYLLVSERSLEIDEKVRDKVEIEKLKYWNSSNDPGLKSGLLKIWNNYRNEKNPEVLIAIAFHPWVPVDVQESLTKYEDDVRVRLAAILNRTDREEAILKLAWDKNLSVRIKVADNSKTPIETLKELARNTNWQVRFAVASNSKTPLVTLRELAKDEFKDVRCRVAYNPNTPIDLSRN